MSAIAYHRVNTYFVALDIVVGKLKGMLTFVDKDILFILCDVVLNDSLAEIFPKFTFFLTFHDA